jgi:transcriptional regulator with XRE-family HTH domain
MARAGVSRARRREAADGSPGTAPARGELTDIPAVGSVIRKVRQERGLSLQQLADASAVSIGTLSQIERNVANPSLRMLTNIRQALRIPLSALFADDIAHADDPDDPPFVRRADRRPLLDLGPRHMVKELLSPSGAEDMQFMILAIPGGGSSGDQALSYACEKAGVVLDGEFTLTVGEQSSVLRAGDSFQFWGAAPHSISNHTTQTARVVWIIGKTLIERHL